jgi:hypothetical protein
MQLEDEHYNGAIEAWREVRDDPTRQHHVQFWVNVILGQLEAGILTQSPIPDDVALLLMEVAANEG